MRQIMAFVDASATAVSVIAAAELFADRLDAELDVVTIGRPETYPEVARVVQATEVVPTMLDEVERSSPALTVIGERAVPFSSEPVGHIAEELLTRSTTPVMVVPPSTTRAVTALAAERRLRVLVPLDGTPETDGAVLELVEMLAAVEIDVVVLHVLDQTTAPGIIDTTADVRVLAAEFGHRHIPGADEVLLRLGDPARHILGCIHAAAADQKAIDAVVVGWGQSLAPGRAHVVKQLLREAEIPVIFCPVA